jgi:hypothetical protein
MVELGCAVDGPTNLSEDLGELRQQAERARRLARELGGDVAEGRLLELAQELEARAAALEQAEQGVG